MIGIISAIVILVFGTIVWINSQRTFDVLRHETDRWAVIEDFYGDRIVVEPVSDRVWSQLVQLQQNGSRRWVGGIVEKYGNKWGFRFRPENVTVSEVTAEGLQATIKYISENLDYWLNLGWAYVYAKVTEIHFSS